jgi:hypothetical protein
VFAHFSARFCVAELPPETATLIHTARAGLGPRMVMQEAPF